MSITCPRPCGRLATAAIFISVGVVQLVAGAFLLKSKYVYLLSAPDFWTAFCNIAVGGLLGVSAGVWNNTSKNSSKHAVRRNVLAALVTSAILINSTTSAILILGEGNTLLSIHLENNGIYSSATLASEILAYAYAASVCSPIFCVVVSIIFLSGMCFPKGRRKSLDIQKVSENGSTTFNWVYKTERGLPKPDPEIVKKVLSSKSLTSSDDSSSSTEFPLHHDSIHRCDSSLTRGIRAIEQQNGQESPRTAYRCEEWIEKYPDLSMPRKGNRISFVDELPVKGRKFQRDNQSSRESPNQYNIQRFKTRKGDIYKLRDYSKYDRENEELLKIEGIRPIYQQQNQSSSVANASTNSERSNYIPRRIFSSKKECLSPDENFGENLRSFEHRSLRRTSTQADITGISARRVSQDLQNCNNSPPESLNHTMLQKTVSSESSNSAAQNSTRTIFDLTNQSIDSRPDNLHGEVIPIQVNTFPRKKLQSKLIPVPIPVISKTKNVSLIKSKELKFDDPRREGFTSFRGGRQMKNRSKSTGSYSANYSIPSHPTARNVTVSEAPVEDNNLELSPTHTSGYISTIEDIVEPPNQNFSKSVKVATSNSSPSDESGSSGYVSVRKKFRAEQRKTLDGGRPPSKTTVIHDVLKEIMTENPLLSSRDSINELFYNILLQKVTHELEDY